MTLGIKVACVQMRSGIDPAENIRVASALIREAAAVGAVLIATPEMTGFLDRAPGAARAKSRTETEDEALAAFRLLAAELGVWLQIGSLSIRLDEEVCVNRGYLLSDTGGIVARYDKIHMFDAQIDAENTYQESRLYRAGTQAVVATMPQALVGLSICYDLRFPYLYRALAQNGAQIISIPAAFTQVTGAAHWHVLTRARAIETGCFVLAAGQGGTHEDGRSTYGHSLILSPWGEILAEAGADPQIITAELDMTQVESARKKVASLEHDRTFTITRVP